MRYPEVRSARPWATLLGTRSGRGFVGRSQVLANWSAVFDGVPDFTAELVAGSLDGDTEWAEWDRSGTYTSGTAFLMRGITILTLRDGLIAKSPAVPRAG
jgi:hypothetical protein